MSSSWPPPSPLGRLPTPLDPLRGDPLDDGASARQNVLRVVAILKRRWWLPVGLAGLAAASFMVFQLSRPPQFVSTGLIQLGMYAHLSIDDRDYRPSHEEFLETHTKLLTSIGVVDAALRRLGFETDEPELRAFQRDFLLRSVAIRPVRQTYLIEIESSAGSPEYAAEQVNALMDAFIPYSAWWFLGSRWLEREQTLLEKEQVVLRGLAAAEDKQRALYAEAGSVPYEQLRDGLNKSEEALQEQLTTLQIERAVAETERERFAERLEEVAHAEPPEDYVGLFRPGAFDRRLEAMNAIGGRLVHLRATVAADRLERLPDYLDLEAQLTAERYTLAAEMRARAQADLGQRDEDVAVLASREVKIRELLGALAEQIRRVDLLEGRFRTIRRELEWYDKELEETRDQLRELQSAGNTDGGARIINRGEIPARAQVRLRPANMFFVAILAFGLGLVSIVAWDHLDDTLRRKEDAAWLGLPVLGEVPHLDFEEVDELTHVEGSSWLTEAFGLIRTNLSVAVGGGCKGALLVTSAEPGEGKSFVSLNLAAALARTGGRTLLVEADLRRPALQAIVGTDRPEGLSDVLRGDVSLADAVQETELPGVWFLASGVCPLNPADLLIRGQFDAVVRGALEGYDHVVVDAPPARNLADTSLMAPYVTGVVQVARLGSSRRRHLVAAVGQVEAVGGLNLGVVVNDVPPDGEASFAYYGGEASANDQEPAAGDTLFIITTPRPRR